MTEAQQEKLAQYLRLGEATPASMAASALLVARAALATSNHLEELVVGVAKEMAGLCPGGKFDQVDLHRAVECLLAIMGKDSDPGKLATLLVSNAVQQRKFLVESNGLVSVAALPDPPANDGLVTLRDFAKRLDYRGDVATRFIDRLEQFANRHLGGLKPEVQGQKATHGQAAVPGRFNPAYLTDVLKKMQDAAGTNPIKSEDSRTNP